MKLFTAALAMVCISTSVQAQLYARAESHSLQTKTESPLRVNTSGNVAYKISRPPGLRMRNTGRVLTIIGGAMLIGGIVVFNNADSDYYNSYTTSSGTYTEGDPQAALGVLMIAGGAGMTVPGIIFWSKGAKKYNRHLEREAAFNFRGSSISLSYRF